MSHFHSFCLLAGNLLPDFQIALTHSILKHSDEGLPAAPSQETKIPERSVEDPNIVSEIHSVKKSNRKVKFKQKDDDSLKKQAADTPTNKTRNKITQYFSVQ